MKSHKLLRVLAVILFIAIVYFGGIFGLIYLVNSDLYGRLTETEDFGIQKYSSQLKSVPTIRLIIHRIMSDENQVEASLAFEADYDVVSDPYWQNAKGMTAGVRDASALQSVYFTTPLNISWNRRSSGDMGIAFQSERFYLPILPSVEGFPFDNIEVCVMPYLYDDNNNMYPYKFEVQKAFSGRLLHLIGNDPLNPKIKLVRSNMEIYFVLFGGIVFILLSLIIAFLLSRSTSGFKSWEEILAFAGYIISAAGFREMLGISRNTGISAYEVLVFGIPLLFLTCVMIYAIIKNIIRKDRKEDKTMSAT